MQHYQASICQDIHEYCLLSIRPTCYEVLEKFHKFCCTVFRVSHHGWKKDNCRYIITIYTVHPKHLSSLHKVIWKMMSHSWILNFYTLKIILFDRYFISNLPIEIKEVKPIASEVQLQFYSVERKTEYLLGYKS